MDTLLTNYIMHSGGADGSDTMWDIIGSTIVKGGTGWAVQMAIDSDKDAFVFDQSSDCWFTYDIDFLAWRQIEVPSLTLDFAGIGTREIKPNGLKAIIDCYDLITKEKTLF